MKRRLVLIALFLVAAPVSPTIAGITIAVAYMNSMPVEPGNPPVGEDDHETPPDVNGPMP